MKHLKPKYAIALLSVFFFSIAQAQIISTIAGDSIQDYNGDGGVATSASLNLPMGVAVDSAGNIYIADYNNQRIRKVDTKGIISTVAGNGWVFYSGNGGAATDASLYYPTAVTVDAAGNLYIADAGNERIRKVNKKGVISTVAGNGDSGYSGDGGLATSTSLESPRGVAVDAVGNIYIADYSNHRIRKVDISGVISTVAGNGAAGFSGDGDVATNAELFWPSGVAVDALGNIYIVDYGNNRIRKVNTSGVISTVAGKGRYQYGGFSGDGGAAIDASLNGPCGVALDAVRNIYIADFGNTRIRKVDTSGVINTVTGNGTSSYSGDGGPATSASLSYPSGVAVDVVGNIFVADEYNNVIRKVTSSTVPITLFSFTAIANNKTITTNWNTSTELNTSHFTIQHSKDGISYTTIGTVKTIGSGANGYSFTDTHPTNGTNYYRLESVDKDGASSYSKVISCEWLVVSKQFTVVPNPARDIVTVKGNHIASVQVVDNLGKVLKTVSFKDATNPTLSVGGLPKGVYHLRVETIDGKVSGASLLVSDL